MSENTKTSKLSLIFEKIKRIKHLDVILTIMFVAIILLVYFSSTKTFPPFSSTKGQSENSLGNNTTSSALQTSFASYEDELTTKAENIISAIKGAGQVSVMFKFSESISQEIAYSTETKFLSDGTKLETKSPIFVDNDGKKVPLVLKETLPSPVSVIVVSSGASETSVKLEILRLIEAMFNLNSSKVEIFVGK